jgi:hypothetical protein
VLLWDQHYQNPQGALLTKVKTSTGGVSDYRPCAGAGRHARLREREDRALLAAIVYDPGFPIDDLVLATADTLRSEGVRLRGAVQENTGSTSCSAMTLVDLATGEHFSISQDLGVHAQGCRLDPRGLADAAARLDAATRADFDLLILNKFGKAEAEGGGLRSALVRALGAGKPVLSSVRAPYLEAWSRFHGGLATDLPPRLDPVLAWCRRAIGGQRLRHAELHTEPQ